MFLNDPEIFWCVYTKKTQPKQLTFKTSCLQGIPEILLFDIYYCNPMRTHSWQNPPLYIKSTPLALCAFKIPLDHRYLKLAADF